MRRFAFFAPLAATLAVAAGVQAQPINNQPSFAAPEISVTVGGDLVDDVEKLGQRDVDLQIAELTKTLQRELARSGALSGSRINLVMTDLKPNHPTIQQTVDKPGLSMFDSVSIGGVAIEGEVITADGERLPVRYSRYSTSIADVFGYNTWEEADRAYDRFASNLSRGRLVSR